jgi:hypothetical protein
MRTRFRFLALVLTFVMIFGAVGTALASPAKADGKHYSRMFRDTAIEDYEWAFKYIEKLGTLGVIRGNGFGQFQGKNAIKHEEAVAMIVRYMNLEQEAIAHSTETIPVTDAARISLWARGYVKVALERDLLWLPDSSVITVFGPNNPTTRLEAVVMLVKAADLEDEAEDSMDATLPFKDAHLIPTGLIGYVAVAIEKQLVKGYDDHTFQPNKPVTRAEMATFLGRGMDQIPSILLGHTVAGTLVSTTATSVTLRVHGVQYTFNVKADAPIYRNNLPVALTALIAGDRVELKLDTNGVAVFVEAKAGDDNDDDDDDLLITEGVIKEISTSQTGTALKITLDGNAGDKLYPLATGCVIKIGGVVKTAADLLVGDHVHFKLDTAGTSIIELLATRAVVPTTYSGVIETIVPLTTNPPTTVLVIDLDNVVADGNYTINADCPVKIDGVTKAVANLLVGDRVTFKLDTTGLRITELAATRTTITNVSGTITGINYTGRTLTFGTGSTAVTHNVSATAEIKFLGVALAWDHVLLDDVVTLTLTNGVVTKIDVTTHTVTLTGVVKSTSTDATGNHVVLTVGTQDYTVDVPTTATITQNGLPVGFGAITFGKTINVVGMQSVAAKVVAAVITIQP